MVFLPFHIKIVVRNSDLTIDSICLWHKIHRYIDFQAGKAFRKKLTRGAAVGRSLSLSLSLLIPKQV